MGSRTSSPAVVARLQRWIDEHVTQPQAETNDLPACPFAAGAFTEGSVLCHLSPVLGMVDFIKSTQPTRELSHIVFVPVGDITASYFTDWLTEQNKSTFGWWTMGYHPHADQHAPVWEHYDEDDHVLVLVQNLAELVEASGRLAAKGYYDKAQTWQIEDIVDRQEASNAWQEIEKKIATKAGEENLH